MTITLDKVFRTYNGRSGCACGCNGRYSLHRAEDIEPANREAGWEANSAEDVRPMAVKRAIAKLNAAIEEYLPLAKPSTSGVKGLEYVGDDVWFFMCDEFAAIDQAGRATTVYFRKPEPEATYLDLVA